jgi:hypothetical protein
VRSADTYLDPEDPAGHRVPDRAGAAALGLRSRGTGLGRGSPTLVPNARPTSFAAIGELGSGTLGAPGALILLVGACRMRSMRCDRSRSFRGRHRDDSRLPDLPHHRRVTRDPLMGITPRSCRTRSSLVANRVRAILLRISDDNARPTGRSNGGDIRRATQRERGTVAPGGHPRALRRPRQQLTYLQLVDSYSSPTTRTTRRFLQDLRHTGPDRRPTAPCSPSNDSLKYQRSTRPPPRTCSRTWWVTSPQFGSVGVEAQYSSALAGKGNLLPTTWARS